MSYDVFKKIISSSHSGTNHMTTYKIVKQQCVYRNKHGLDSQSTDCMGGSALPTVFGSVEAGSDGWVIGRVPNCFNMFSFTIS